MVVPEGGGWGGSGLQAGRGTKAIRNMYNIKLTTIKVFETWLKFAYTQV